LTADTVATVTLDGNFGRIEVLNRDGSAEVYFTTDNSDPVVLGANSHVLPAAIGAVEVADDTSGSSSIVKMISTGTPAVSVRGM
jgi:hypothetical protein